MLIVAITLFVANYTLCTSFFELNGFKKMKICCHGTAVQSHIINILSQFLGLGNMGKYSVRGWQYWPDRNTATLELNISPYCPPSHAMIYIYIIILWGRSGQKDHFFFRDTSDHKGQISAWPQKPEINTIFNLQAINRSILYNYNHRVQYKSS